MIISSCTNGWIAIRLTSTYKIDVDDPYQFDDKDFIYLAPYLFEQIGEYGVKEKRPDYIRLDRLDIWTSKDKKVYMLGASGLYYLLDQESDELTTSEELIDFSEQDQIIFSKLENHPELYAEIQEMRNGKNYYSLNGKGQVNLEDLE